MADTQATPAAGRSRPGSGTGLFLVCRRSARFPGAAILMRGICTEGRPRSVVWTRSEYGKSGIFNSCTTVNSPSRPRVRSLVRSRGTGPSGVWLRVAKYHELTALIHSHSSTYTRARVTLQSALAHGTGVAMKGRCGSYLSDRVPPDRWMEADGGPGGSRIPGRPDRPMRWSGRRFP